MLAFVLTVICYVATSLLFYPLVFIDPFKGRKVLSRIIAFYSKVSLLFMGVKVSLDSKASGIQKSFIVSNHLGYLDVLVIASKIPSCFVTSLEIRKTPFLGQLCELGGCLYVDRKSKENLSKEVEMLTKGLNAGLNICVFPEGTSTNGSSVLKFKRPLFKAAIDATVPTVSLCLNYQKINGKEVSEKNRDFIFWYGDMSFLPHLWSFFKLKSVVVGVDCVGKKEGASDYIELSEQSHSYVNSHYIAIL